MIADRSSKRQRELLMFVDGFIKGNGYGPSYREIMRALGYKSVSTVAIHINGLIEKGYLRKKDNSARSIEVITLDDMSLAAAEDSTVVQLIEQEIKDRLISPGIKTADLEVLIEAAGILGSKKADEFRKKLQTTP